MTKSSDTDDVPEEGTRSISRRSVVKAMGTASGTAFVTSNPVSAVENDLTKQEQRERAKKVRAKYSDVETVRNVLKTHTLKFIQGLHENGYLPEPGLSQFKLSKINTFEEILDEGQGITINSLPAEDDGFKVDITLHTSTQDGEIEIHTVPKSGRTFAIKDPRDEEKRTPIKQTADGPSPDEFCQSYNDCIPTHACACDSYAGCIHNEYSIDCCKDGCYYSRTYKCCSDATCWNSAICDCYC